MKKSTTKQKKYATPRKAPENEPPRTESEILKEKVSELEGKLAEKDREFKMKINYVKHPHLLHIPENVVEREEMKMQNEEMKKKLAKISSERNNISERAKTLEKEKADMKKDKDITIQMKDLEINKLNQHIETNESKLTDLEENNDKLQIEAKKVKYMTENISALETTILDLKQDHAMLEESVTLSEEKKSEENEKYRAKNEIELARVTKLLTQVNKDADKYRWQLEKHRQQTQLHTGDANKELEQMKKMIAGLTNFIALQAEDKDGNGAVVIVTHMKGMLDMKDPTEQECGLNAIYNLITEKNREKIKRIDGLEPKVDGLTKSEYEYVRAAAKRTLSKIKREKLNPRYGRGIDIRCQYFHLCKKFMETLHVDDSYIDALYNCCYCADCHTKRGDRLYYSRGDPVKDYGIPIGWARFALEVNDTKATTQKIWDDWHVAFHGTEKESVRHVLEVGYLVNPGDTIIGGIRIGVRPGHIPESDKVRKLFMSPSIRYAGNEAYATSTSFTDPTSYKTYKARVVLQIRIKPSSYEVREQTIGATSQIDPGYLNSELEWCTNQHGSTVIQGILIKLEN